MAAAPIIFAAVSTAASAASAIKSLTTKAPKAPALPELPAKPADTAPDKTAVAQRRNRTLLFADQGTRPSTLLAGASPPAPVVRSTLLGM
jgi:hypothetical protein